MTAVIDIEFSEVRPARVRKYLRGRKITPDEAFHEITVAKRYIFQGHKPQHPSWMGSMPLFAVASMARAGQLYYAHINPDYVEREPKDAETNAP